jgi:hypothetical protein
MQIEFVESALRSNIDHLSGNSTGNSVKGPLDDGTSD